MFRLSVILLVLIPLAGCNSEKSIQRQPTAADVHRETIEQIIQSESTILDLAPYVSKIADSMTKSGQESKESLREIFADTTNYLRINASSPTATSEFLDELWQPFLAERKFAECQFGTLSGTFAESGQRFDMKTKFEGKIRDGQAITGVQATQTITWTRINKLWTITAWTQHTFEVSESEQPLFADATDSFIAEADTRSAVTRSSHQQRVLDAVNAKTVMEPLVDGLPGFNDWESAWQFPSVSIVDYDNDGWDDVFLTDRWGGGMMLHNVEGKLIDTTAESGLDVGAGSNCVVFADFDNDGDPDAFVGRSLSDSQFFINENGTFQLDSLTTEGLSFVRLVTAGSVADFNGDGLLDLYLSTYVSPSGFATKDWIGKMIAESDREKMANIGSQHPFIDRGGPANILLINENGKLKRCDASESIKQWRNSYQSVWHDWDNDGDPDLFVSNDFAPDSFLRNDTVKGSNKPVFVDVTRELIGPDIMGYSMGASWGDFDNDGDLDLYVSEMYSKAGNRILEQFSEADRRSVESAKGNFLFRNDGGRFTQVAGSAESNQHVAKVGWSFGGQFADFNNDCWLDLYVPSGFYSAPKSVRCDADL
ncbi:FG-GAP repeat domain-containing protein [Mariniblastus fucicola]|uniref:FG-GAP repeat protein n=1 Tax=Mariniblastus fucicola TaxID=980251 RepID=A0A5B9PDR5_9BACT|nr:VCBS repeat-containing protein [Mariniblastus fucicola]QEG23270.1 FG-GAP repeat protein [Mariniblastus fucicola]